jgi:GNAT superfamily N-acetyltransferase
VPQYRRRASAWFQELLSASRAEYIECQSNDLLLSSMLYEFSACVSADTVLFEDHAVTEHHPAGAIFRRRRNNDRIFEHAAEPVGDYVVEENGEVIATGGFLVHYNPPFADLFMKVRANRRNRGVGSYLLQEVKKECYRAGRVPAARTGLDNLASRATLLKAGLRICGFMLKGRVQAPSA